MGRQSNKKRRATNANTAREKAAAARAIQQRAEQRRRAMVILGSVVAVAVLAAVIAVVVLNHKSKSSPDAANRAPAPVSVVDAIGNVPTSTLDAVGAGTVIGAPKPTTGAALTSAGKPELLFIGAEFCPYCAAERWSMAVALSRFGTLNNIKLTKSSSTDTDPNTATLDFINTTYTSPYLSFVAVEDEDRNGNPLQKPTTAENALWAHYDTVDGKQGFPFLDFANKYVVTGPTLDPALLKGLTQTQIAAKLATPTDPVAKAVDGAANLITASICGITNNAPAKVCSDKTIAALQTQINRQKSS